MVGFRNNFGVEGADHKRVVELIRERKDALELVVISVTPSEARKLDGPMDAVSHIDTYDYADRRPIAVTIPDTRLEEADGQKFMAS